MMIRRAKAEDLGRLTEIYNQAVRSGRSTADTETFTADGRRQWFSGNADERTPIFVYEHCGAPVGYCYLSAYRPGRQALADVAEISYYVDFAFHRQGIGGELLEHTIAATKRLGYRHLVAILLSCNEGSIALLKKFGFELWGSLPNIALIKGQRYSHVYYGLDLIGPK